MGFVRCLLLYGPMEDCRPAGILRKRGEARVFIPDIRWPKRLF